MSGPIKTLQGKLSDGTIVQLKTSAGWDTYSWHWNGKKWYPGEHGFSARSVWSRANTRANLGYWSSRFEVIVMAEVIPAVIEEYFASRPELADIAPRIQLVFFPKLGWVEELPGGFWPGSRETDRPYKLKGSRPAVSELRKLARWGAEAVAVGNTSRTPEFQMAELGLRLPKTKAA